MTTKINLDDNAIYAKYDPDNMLARIHELPWQCEQAWQAALKFPLPDDYATVNKAVILGMGGSAIGGDLVRSLALTEGKIPVFVQRDYDLPAFVDEKTLVIASSYSGNTEETISAFKQAMQTGARKLAITTGGKIKEMAEAHKIPVSIIDYQAQPRAALGFSFLPILAFLQKLGFIKDKSADVAEMLTVMKEMLQRTDEKAPLANNHAKQLAEKLYGNLTVVYGAGILSEVAHRWKTQINENSKSWAFYEIFPELNHNATVGYPLPEEIAGKVMVVLLRAPSFNPRIQLRYRVTCELLERAKVKYEIVDSEGKTALSRMMSMVLSGDLTSYYMAILYQIDPSPVDVISYLKDQLSKA
ncbi:bifunctional phosphoglucose/phosphomannose isomerase [Chloroflexota bacterium]